MWSDPGMKIPLTYNLRSVRQRPVSTALTALGIGLVVAVFIGMLALANGFAAALTRTGSDRNVLVLRKGADSEMSSGLERGAISTLIASPHVARGPDGGRSRARSRTS
jgi:putative ABC transport system permease protein